MLDTTHSYSQWVPSLWQPAVQRHFITDICVNLVLLDALLLFPLLLSVQIQLHGSPHLTQGVHIQRRLLVHGSPELLVPDLHLFLPGGLSPRAPRSGPRVPPEEEDQVPEQRGAAKEEEQFGPGPPPVERHRVAAQPGGGLMPC